MKYFKSRLFKLALVVTVVLFLVVTAIVAWTVFKSLPVYDNIIVDGSNFIGLANLLGIVVYTVLIPHILVIFLCVLLLVHIIIAVIYHIKIRGDGQHDQNGTDGSSSGKQL